MICTTLGRSNRRNGPRKVAQRVRQAHATTRSKIQAFGQNQDGTNEERKATAFVDRRWRQGSDNGVAISKHIFETLLFEKFKMKSIKHRLRKAASFDVVQYLNGPETAREGATDRVGIHASQR